MPSNLSLLPPAGRFVEIYRRLESNKALFNRTPIVFCEGDSWFSTPLAMNILDWLVYPTPDEEEQGVPVIGRGGLFFRDEASGSLATEMFTTKGVKRLMKYYGAFEFDIALLSGGGNDFVGTFLKKMFSGLTSERTPEEAFERIVSSGRYDVVYQAWELMLSSMVTLRPKTPIVTHTYCYPLKLGAAGPLTLRNIGAAALFKKDVGPWIGPFVGTVLPGLDAQRALAKMMINGFFERVLTPLQEDKRFRRVFRVLDIRNDCPDESDWFDEMHPTGASFHRLSKKFAAEIAGLFELP